MHSQIEKFAAMQMGGSYVTAFIMNAWRRGPSLKVARTIAPDLTVDQFEAIGTGRSRVIGSAADGFAIEDMPEGEAN